MSIDLIANWSDLVGDDHARNSRPRRIIWPRDDDGRGDGFVAGTLELSCNPQYVLFLQHESHSILERINTYFGFTAVTRLKLDQLNWIEEPRRQASHPTALSGDKAATLAAMIDCVEDPDLKRALNRLGKGVFTRKN